MKDGCCCYLRDRLIRENYIGPKATLLSWDMVMEELPPNINFLPPKQDKDKTTVELMQEVILVVRQGSAKFNARRRKMMYDDRATTE
jgi:hypothetical protein